MGKKIVLFLKFWGLVCSLASTQASPSHFNELVVINIENPDSFYVARKGGAEYFLSDLYGHHHMVSSGRINVWVENYFVPKQRSGRFNSMDGRRYIVKPMLSFQTGSESSVGLDVKKKVYQPFTLSLKYKYFDYPSILDYPSPYERTPLEAYLYFLKHPSGADTLIKIENARPIEKIMQKTLVDAPYLVEEIWDEIPDPPKIVYGDGFIEKKSAHEEILRLLSVEGPDAKGKLNKRAGPDRPWTYGGTENIQFSQAFLENWAKGGQNSISLLSDLRINAKYKKENVEWESYAIHKLGFLSAEDQKSRVNDDLIELNSKYGVSAGKKWFYSGLINFKTQFFNGYSKNDVDKENPISGFMAPAYFTAALGMDYKEKNFTLMLLPFTSKLTYVADTAKIDQTKYKIPEDKKSDTMGGASLVNSLKWSFAKDFNLSSKLDFFYEYMGTENQVQGEWELILDMKINIFLKTRIATYLRYYSNESDKLQFKENLSIAFSYRF
ncbi:DUF3078 domain-containing protein [Thermophagus xiamenensis]|uniref:DUF3078 domain-containing protein n=1 Tax=Thermophagus xiamenensis TaxID=385682 RepID=A0A1I2BKD8_9BACT|nr:DUF3078 domain-containing protein [Thermophagus xiamenensis]SFE56662.1 Protein of unknown function [Thermophagus xiamenensis]